MGKRERIHSNKKYLALFYDRCETLTEQFTDDEIGAIIRSAIGYELYGDLPTVTDKAEIIMCSAICSDIDIMTQKANEFSERQRQKGRLSHQGKNREKADKSEGMTSEQMDEEINEMFHLCRK